MNRMNLSQLINFFAKNGFPQTASYFAGCANDSVTIDGLIEADFVKRHVGEGDLWRNIQANVTTYVGCEEFKFTFETEQEQYAAERTGYIDEYDCVRIEIQHLTKGGTIDFPVKNREEYNKMLEFWNNDELYNIVKVYPTVHSYDAQDYL